MEVETESGGESATLSAELIDISQTGVRLRSEAPIATGDTLTITVSFKDLTQVSNLLIVRGQVCRTIPAREGRYWGCAIEPTIPQKLLENLVESGILERRCDGRQETSITLPAKWECDQTEVSASILNISDGGMCLLISKMKNVGDRLRLTLFDEDAEPAYAVVTACWQIATDDGHVLGCEFEDRAAYLRLKHVADRQKANATMSLETPGESISGGRRNRRDRHP